MKNISHVFSNNGEFLLLTRKNKGQCQFFFVVLPCTSVYRVLLKLNQHFRNFQSLVIQNIFPSDSPTQSISTHYKQNKWHVCLIPKGTMCVSWRMVRQDLVKLTPWWEVTTWTWRLIQSHWIRTKGSFHDQRRKCLSKKWHSKWRAKWFFGIFVGRSHQFVSVVSH